MKICKIIMILLSFFYMSQPASFGQDFDVADFARLLSNHPLTKNYDPESGRFKNTPSEILPLETLAEEINSLEQQIKNIRLQKALTVGASIIEDFDADAEDDIWIKIDSFDKQITKLEEELALKNGLIENSGIPEDTTVLTVINEIHQNVRSQFIASSLPGSIILNKLPVFPVEIPEVVQEKNGLLNYFYTRDRKSLNNYLSFNYSIGMLFKSIDLPILYKAGE